MTAWAVRPEVVVEVRYDRCSRTASATGRSSSAFATTEMLQSARGARSDRPTPDGLPRSRLAHMSLAWADARRAAGRARRWVGMRVERAVSPRVLDRLGVRRRRFEKAAQTGIWSSSGESLSGDGSSLQATEGVRTALPLVLAEFNVRTLLDVPCGDWNWMSQVDLPLERYIGGDIATSLIDANRERYGSAVREFLVIDLCTDSLPPADMLLCRDALVHFSFADIWRVLENVRSGDIGLFATTTFLATRVNSNQPTGRGWRHLNLRAPPFNLPEPLRVVVDNHNRADQRLCVWKVSDLPNAQTAQ